MSVSSNHETIDTLEASIKELAEESKSYEQLKVLTKAIPNILKIEQLAAMHKKKLKELKETTKTNKNLLKLIRENSQNFSKKLEAKLSNAKTSSNSASESSIKDIIEKKKIEIYFKEEVCGAVKHIDNMIKSQESAISFDLSTIQNDISKYKAKLNGEESVEELCDPPMVTDDIRQKLAKYVDASVAKATDKCIQIGQEKFISFEENYKKVLESLIKTNGSS